MKKNILSLFLISVLLVSCSNDDDNDPQNQLPDIEQLRVETLQNISNGESKTWKISEATLINENGTFNVSNSFNVKDDDIIIESNGTVRWLPGYDINGGATSSNTVALDYYLAPDNSNLVFVEESAIEFTAFDGKMTLKLENDILSGVILFDGRMASGELNITLSERGTQDYPQPQTSGLTFNQITTLPTELIIGGGAAGFIGSYSDNSLFVVGRRDTSTSQDEGILKYNLDNNQWSENFFDKPDFVTKRLNIINNNLVVFGARYVHTYPLSPNGNPTAEFTHNLNMTRFGLAAQGDFAYVTEHSVKPSVAANILKFNYLTNSISTITTLSKSRAHAGTEIINNKLYIFGGQTEFNSDIYEKDCFIVDLNTGAISSFDMTEAPSESFATKYQNLIYVGYNYLDNNNPKIAFGVYNTQDNTFTDIPHNLTEGNDRFLEGITFFNDNIYALYRINSVIEIYQAPIN